MGMVREEIIIQIRMEMDYTPDELARAKALVFIASQLTNGSIGHDDYNTNVKEIQMIKSKK